MTDGWLFIRIIGWASALVFVLYVVLEVVLPWWREQQRPGRDQELEERLDRLHARHRQQHEAASRGTSEEDDVEATERCD
jgi:hypothetical protein